MPSRSFIPAASVLRRSAAAVLIGISAACGSGDHAADSARGDGDGKEQAGQPSATVATCANADTTPLRLAVRDYITKGMPTPQRFLNAVGTDSALPEDGFKALQDKGPSFFYSSDTTARRKLLDKLASDGPWASLLVVYRGQTPTDGGKAVDIRLGGHYVGGEHDGKRYASKRYGIRCDSTGWRIATSVEEPAT